MDLNVNWTNVYMVSKGDEIMKRLTEKQSAGYDLKALNGEWCNHYCLKQRIETCNECGIYQAIQKLAHYEDLEDEGRLIVLASDEDQLRIFKDKCKICPYWNGESCNKTQCLVYVKIKELSK